MRGDKKIDLDLISTIYKVNKVFCKFLWSRLALFRVLVSIKFSCFSRQASTDFVFVL